MRDFIREMFFNNRYLWVHMLAGMLAAKWLGHYFVWHSVLSAVFVGAVLYEVWQWATGEHRNFPDALADVLMAVISAGIVVW